MSNVYSVMLFVLVFFLGVGVGFVTRMFVFLKRDYDGNILIQKDEDKIVYTLELTDDPEKIQYRNELIFKVQTPK